MAPTAHAAQSRSWKDRDEGPKSRLAILVLLFVAIVASVSIFLWNFYRNRRVAVFATTISVPEYRSGLPDPKYGISDWSTEGSLSEKISLNGLKPWSVLSSNEQIKNIPELEQRLIGITESLKKEGFQPHDTLIIQLRCHAVATVNSKGEENCGLHLGESGNDNDDIYPIQDVIKKLRSIPIKNVVLLADICDLRSVVSKGWAFNPVASSVLKALEKYEPETTGLDRNTWIVCAANDCQSTFISNQRKRTLFQEACEESLKQKNPSSDLLLSEYLENIFRYCHAASAGAQTPRVIWSNGNTSSEYKSAHPDAWSRAQSVVVSRSLDRPRVIKNQEKSQAASTSYREPRFHSGGFAAQVRSVSWTQTQGSANVASPAVASPVVQDASLQTPQDFWQARDRILDRSRTDVDIEKSDSAPVFWSPSVFAPLAWRRAQWEIAQSSNLPKNKAIVSKYNPKAMLIELQELEKHLGDLVSKCPRVDGQEIASAWNEFKLPAVRRILWQEDPGTILSPQQATIWRRLRKEYLSYGDSLSQLGFWGSLVHDFPELRPKFELWLSAIESVQAKLPNKKGEFALEKSIEMRMSQASRELSQLRSILSEKIDSLVKRKDKELSWTAEQEIQALLANPVLSFDQRSDLVRVLSSTAPPQKVIMSRDQELDELMQQPNMSAAVIQNKCMLLRRILMLVSDTNLSDPNSVDLIEMLKWSKEYVNEVKRVSKAELSDLARWHLMSLIELDFEGVSNARESCTGIVVPPIDPKTPQVSLQNLDATLDFGDSGKDAEVKIGVKSIEDSTLQEGCELKWTLNSDLKGFSVRLDGDQFEMNKPLSVRADLKQSQLRCFLEDRTVLPADCFLTVEVVGSGLKKLDIPLVRNSERIDLLVSQVTKEGRNVTPLIPVGNQPFVLKSPAFTGVHSRFVFALQNKKPRDRAAQMRVFVRDGSSDTLLVASEIVRLPGLGRPVPITWKASVEAAPTVLSDAIEKQLAFRVVEFEVPAAGTQAEENSIPKQKGSTFEYVGRFKPQPPSDFILVQASQPQLDQKLEFTIAMALGKQFWEQYEVKSPIEIVPLLIEEERSQTFSPIVLSSQKSSERFLPRIVKSNSDFRTELTVGGFIRAMSYVTRGNPVETNARPQPRSEILSVDGVLNGKKAALKKSRTANGAYVVPNKDGDLGVKCTGITIQCSVEMAENNPHIVVFKKNESLASQVLDKVLKEDRTYESEIGIEENRLRLGYTASELAIKLDTNVASLEGEYTIRLAMPGSKSSEAQLVFDRQPPEAGAEVRCDSATARLGVGGKISVFVEAWDRGSGVDKVKFAKLRAEGGAYDDADPTDRFDEKLVKPDGQKFSFVLQADQFQGLPKGKYAIVARTLDAAGNWQDDNKPLIVYWDDAM
jgi:hypothetical protein